MSEGLAFTRAAVADWHLTTAAGAAAADAVLVAAELLANACQHAGRPLALHLQLTPGRLRVAVTDPDPTPPRRVEPHRPATPHGHGLVVVDRIAADWGCTPVGDGKTVWADLPLPASDGTAEPDLRPARRTALANPDPLMDT
ncbi:ATP-binding protein [Kitasatospora sp. DSM 101779]|uniref:ATP-binding protein n=1 Tax=Kitasatospora sp. DSM 101779 TaxID=2853165 RepID=UPI0021DB5C67|nr:ATP-binding protein [Kitasatospora sp. DSM 101779]MCU7826001.1 ATP-binding protein [Kitasatospora sp. DSM 101779]